MLCDKLQDTYSEELDLGGLDTSSQGSSKGIKEVSGEKTKEGSNSEYKIEAGLKVYVNVRQL